MGRDKARGLGTYHFMLLHMFVEGIGAAGLEFGRCG